MKYDLDLGYPVWINTTEYEWSSDLGYRFRTHLGLDAVELESEPDWDGLGDPFTVSDFAIWQGDKTRLYLDFSARGFGDYQFKFVTDGVFSEAPPPAVEVIASFRREEACGYDSVLPRQREYFELGSLVELFEDVYGESGTFVVNQTARGEGVEEAVGSVLYVPQAPTPQDLMVRTELTEGLVEDDVLVSNAYLLPGDQVLELDFRAPCACASGVLELSSSLAFKKVFPPEVDLFLRYEKSGDDCIGEDLGKARFDMTSIADDSHEKFGGLGPMLLNLYTIVNGEKSLVRKLPYFGSAGVLAQVSSFDEVPEVPEGFGEEPFDVYSTRIYLYGDKPELHINVTVDGGCRVHSYRLSSDFSFKESSPVQVDVFLRHDSNGDGCESRISGSLKYDIASILDPFTALYGDDAPLIITVKSIVDGVEEVVGQATYDPL